MTISRRLHAMLAVAVVATGCGLATHSHATDNDPGVWTIFSTTDSFSEAGDASRWHYWFDAQARYFDIGSGTNQWLVRPAIGYEIRDGMKAWAGYARFRSRNGAGRVTDENRYWQQLDWRAGQWLNGNVSMRVRLEQRSVDTGDDLRVVLRFMTKYVRPFAKHEDRNLIVSLEPFVDLRDTDWGGDAGLGQNRIFVGMGWKLSDKVTVETGYMNQFIWVDNAEDRINHLAILTIKARL